MFWHVTTTLWFVYAVAIAAGRVWLNINASEQFLFVTTLALALNRVHATGHHSFTTSTWWIAWIRAHLIGHHVGAYPTKAFDSESYRVNPYDPWLLNGMLYLVVTALWLLGVGKYVFCWTGYQIGGWAIHTAILLAVENKLHHEIHLKESSVERNVWLHNQEWFQYLKRLHRSHHSGNMQCNFAVLNMWTDCVWGSFYDSDQRYAQELYWKQRHESRDRQLEKQKEQVMQWCTDSTVNGRVMQSVTKLVTELCTEYHKAYCSAQNSTRHGHGRDEFSSQSTVSEETNEQTQSTAGMASDTQVESEDEDEEEVTIDWNRPLNARPRFIHYSPVSKPGVNMSDGVGLFGNPHLGGVHHLPRLSKAEEYTSFMVASKETDVKLEPHIPNAPPRHPPNATSPLSGLQALLNRVFP